MARGPNEQVEVSAGLRAVQNEQPNGRQCSGSPAFRGVNTERAGQTWEKFQCDWGCNLSTGDNLC